MKSSRLSQAGVVSLTSSQQQLILGTLLGDGNMSKTGLRPRYRAAQGEPQREYLTAKYQALRELVRTPPKQLVNRGHGSTTWAFTTLTTELFEPIWALCYPGGKKRVTAAWLEQLTLEGLAWAWMDDGHCGRTHGVLNTQGFSHEENQLIASWLTSMGFDASVSSERGKYWSVRLSLAGLRRLAEQLSPYVVDSMRYKIQPTPAPPTLTCPSCGTEFQAKNNQVGGVNAVCGSPDCLRWQGRQRNQRHMARSENRETKNSRTRERYQQNLEAERARGREKQRRVRSDPERHAKQLAYRREWRKRRSEQLKSQVSST